jgi:hypothetical protein
MAVLENREADGAVAPVNLEVERDLDRDGRGQAPIDAAGARSAAEPYRGGVYQPNEAAAVHDPGPALKRLRRLEPAAPCLRHLKRVLERLRDGVQRRAYSPRVLHLAGVMATEILTGVMATLVMVPAILRVGESGLQPS